jgi:hypothetical protein
MQNYINNQQTELDKYVNVAGMLRGYMRHLAEHEQSYTKDPERIFMLINEALVKTETIIYPDKK